MNFEINNDKKSGLERVPTILITDASLANHSSRLRATCNFSTDGLQYKDYSRHPGTYGVTIALRGNLKLMERHKDSSTRKTISESIAATI